MIRYVEGDILLSDAEAIAHGVAPNDHFDHGLAHALRERWPSMAKDFRHWAHVNHPSPGEAWTWSGAGGVRIVNLLTQDGRIEHGARPEKATGHNVNNALKSLVKIAKKQGFKSVALPRLACGVGGLDWADVKPLVEKHLGDAGLDVFVYTVFHAGQKAAEA
jgi:O-acetyl-ADP-ribose deacetylase (regulator of RNase III)